MSKKPQKKMREKDRLVRNIAICIRREGESQADAEKAVRKQLRLSSLQNHCTETEVLRGMWGKLKSGTAFQRLNEMISKEYMRPLSFAEFDRRKEILRGFQKKARHWNKTRAEALNGRKQNETLSP